MNIMRSKKAPPPLPDQILAVVDLAAGNKLLLQSMSTHGAPVRVPSARWLVRDINGNSHNISDTTALALVYARSTALPSRSMLEEGRAFGRRVSTREGAGHVIREDSKAYVVELESRPANYHGKEPYTLRVRKDNVEFLD